MNNQLPDIDAILDHIYSQDEPESLNASQPRRTITVYIDVEEEVVDHPPTIDSTPNEPPTTTTTDEVDTPRCTEQPARTHVTAPSHTKRQRRTNPALLLLLILSSSGLIAGIGYFAVLVPLWTSSADVTLVTASRHLTTTTTLELVTNGTADLTKNQVPGRALPAMTVSQQKITSTTGTGHQTAQAAQGLITFYNAAPYIQTVAAGTMLTGADGRLVLTDQNATIPAAVMPTEGQTTVVGYAARPGPEGNIRAGDVYGPCCRLNVFASNGAFHGGQDARTYQTVTQQDITSVVTTIKTSLDQSVQAALQTHVQATETLVTPLSCTLKVASDHVAGEQAAQVTVTIVETCQGMVYATQEMIALVTQLATQDAMYHFGKDYSTKGVQTSSITADLNQHNGTIVLHLSSSNLWAYQFDAPQQQAIKTMIAGMSKDKATMTLLHLASVQSVSLTLTHGTTIPTETQQIHLLFVQV